MDMQKQQRDNDLLSKRQQQRLRADILHDALTELGRRRCFCSSVPIQGHCHHHHEE